MGGFLLKLDSAIVNGTKTPHRGDQEFCCTLEFFALCTSWGAVLIFLSLKYILLLSTPESWCDHKS